MLIFQSYAQKKQEDAPDEMEMGIKVKALQKFFESHSVSPQEIAGAVQEIEKSWKKNGISEFISTLTPGAQNAIYAASFAWGLENASQYVKRAMKLDEVKNADGAEGRSKAVIESMQGQAAQSQPQSERSRETTKIVWGFYNEDMKETQAISSKSETQTERQGMEVPLSAHEAVVAGVVNETLQPSLLYCSSVEAEAQEKMHLQQEMQKRQELSTLLSSRQQAKIVENERKAIGVAREKIHAEEGKKAAGAVLEKNIAEAHKERNFTLEKLAEAQKLDGAVQLALQRRDELLREYVKVEGSLLAALEKLEGKGKEEEVLLQATLLLPDELQRQLARKERESLKKENLKKQLLAWLSASRQGRKELSGLPLKRLIKLVSLSSMFKR